MLTYHQSLQALDEHMSRRQAVCYVDHYGDPAPKHHYVVQFISETVKFKTYGKLVGSTINRLLDHWTDFFGNFLYETFRIYLQTQNLGCSFVFRPDVVEGYTWKLDAKIMESGFVGQVKASTLFDVIQELLPMHLKMSPSKDIFTFKIMGLPGTPIDYQYDDPTIEPMGYHMTIKDEVIQSIDCSVLKCGCEPIYLGTWIPIEGESLPHDILESLNALHDE